MQVLRPAGDLSGKALPDLPLDEATDGPGQLPDILAAGSILPIYRLHRRPRHFPGQDAVHQTDELYALLAQLTGSSRRILDGRLRHIPPAHAHAVPRKPQLITRIRIGQHQQQLLVPACGTQETRRGQQGQTIPVPATRRIAEHPRRLWLGKGLELT